MRPRLVIGKRYEREKKVDENGKTISHEYIFSEELPGWLNPNRMLAIKTADEMPRVRIYRCVCVFIKDTNRMETKEIWRAGSPSITMFDYLDEKILPDRPNKVIPKGKKNGNNPRGKSKEESERRARRLMRVLYHAGNGGVRGAGST